MRRTLVERFWAKVTKADDGACWEWIGRKLPRGYGSLSRGARGAGNVYAHRLSYELHIGPIPQGLLVCHHCDNPSCVNPAHLFLGTDATNAADKIRKGRANAPKGTANGHAKLSEEKVLAIRNSAETLAVQARRYGVSEQVIYMAKAGKTWKHVGSL